MSEERGGERDGRDVSGWEVVRIVGTEEEAALIEGFLASCGLPVEIESLLFHQEPVTFGRLGEVRVRVPAEHAAEAARLLAERDDLPPEGSEDEDAAAHEAGGAEPS